MPAVTVAVDAMGGDDAPAANVDGAIDAARAARVGVVLVGAAAALRSELDRHSGAGRLPISVVDAPDVVAMDEPPLAALRRKPCASVRVAADLVARGEAQALFSAGHTGATVLAAHAAFGMLAGVERPALAVTVPTPSGAAILLDAGANLECRADHLVQFALMGAAYARVDLGRDDPAVGLLSVGEEAGKGNDLIREAHACLAAAGLRFIGNLGAQDLFSGRADVIVCDGFTGNIALKVCEGLVETVEAMLREELGASVLARAGALLSRSAFRRFRRRVDYAEYGGAPLLGVGKVALVGHGRSSARAVHSGITMAARLVEERVIERVAETLAASRPARAGHYDRQP
jgi:glycerol-3-phosphate acyltransferase PlsX